MKKLSAVLLVLCMTILCFTGCGKEQTANIRIGSLKGATSLGMLDLMEKATNGESKNTYEFTMATAPDELLPLMIKGELDIALIPANAAANLYKKSEGKVEVIDINTLGVLYFVTGDSNISSIADLEGKTVYLTGKGATPEAGIRYILEKNGLTDKVTLEFKSEATEVATVLAEDSSGIGLLPQPFVTAACMQNDALSVVMDLNEEWGKVSEDGSKMVTGVTVVRKEFRENNPGAVKTFLEEHANSVNAVLADPEHAATLAVLQGIVAKEPIAMKAIPNCNLVCITGAEMKSALTGYIQSLNDFNPELTGGMPADDFYYIE